MADEINSNLGISRRQLIKRGAIVGGTVMWAAPVVQSLTTPAGAQGIGTPSHACCCCTNPDPADPPSTPFSCTGNGLGGPQADAAACRDFCDNGGFSGGRYQNFEYARGTGPAGCDDVGGQCVCDDETSNTTGST